MNSQFLVNLVRIKFALILSLCSTGASARLVTVDVLGVYSNHVSALVADPEARFVSYIAYANRALENSRANYRYRLVHLTEHSWPNDDSLGSTQLSSLRSDATVQNLRTRYGADMVAGLVPQSGNLCGIGYVPFGNKATYKFPSYMKAYAVSLSGHNCGGRTLAHEMGHNMGLGHSPIQGSLGGLADWGRGWGVADRFVTIMAYSSAYGLRSGSGRLQIHSSPYLVSCFGLPCGKSYVYADGADARRALILAAPQVAAWYPTRVLDSGTGVTEDLPPVANDDSGVVGAGGKLTLNVLLNDVDPNGDSLSLPSWGNPQNGTLIRGGGGEFTYTPAAGFSGIDQFSYTVADVNGNESRATARILVLDSDHRLGNLVVNARLEAGTSGWYPLNRSSRIASVTPGYSGQRSLWMVRAAVSVLKRSIRAGAPVYSSAWVRAAQVTTATLAIRFKSSGQWRWQTLTSQRVPAGRWIKLQSIDTFGIDLTRAHVAVLLAKNSHRARVDDVAILH